jgi:hypothetical protein
MPCRTAAGHLLIMKLIDPVDHPFVFVGLLVVVLTGILVLGVQCGLFPGEFRESPPTQYRQKCVCREGVHHCDKCHADTGCYCVPSEKDGCCRTNPNDNVELEPTAEKPCPCPGGYQCETCPYGPCHCHPTKGDFYKAIDAWLRVKASFPNIEIPNE